MSKEPKIVSIPYCQFRGFREDDEIFSLDPYMFKRDGVVYEVADHLDARLPARLSSRKPESE
jgi:hypothetical protein